MHISQANRTYFGRLVEYSHKGTSTAFPGSKRLDACEGNEKGLSVVICGELNLLSKRLEKLPYNSAKHRYMICSHTILSMALK